jgi:hypothetical protein
MLSSNVKHHFNILVWICFGLDILERVTKRAARSKLELIVQII